MRHRSWGWTLALVGLLAAPGATLSGQDVKADAPSQATSRTDFIPLSSVRQLRAPLRREVSLGATRMLLTEALDRIAQQASLLLTYDDAVVAARTRVTIALDRVQAAEALARVLSGTPFDVEVSRDGRLVRVVRERETVTQVAESGSIGGQATDAKTGDRLTGVEVSLEGTRWRATSGDNGTYKLVDVDPGTYTLIARRVGYAKQTRGVTVVSAQEVVVNLALQPVVTQLNEIVTTVTGDQRRLELGHVIGVINADSLVREAPVTSLSELLNGRVPGLQVFTSQGTVGGEVHLQIRGQNSLLLRTEPIVVIDGMRYTSTAAEKVSTYPFSVGPGANAEPTSPLNDLNPNDIASIEVVKGPSAATLYGTDASNGVIVITTKRGQQGAARWNVFARSSRTDIPLANYPKTYWAWGHSGGAPYRDSCALQRVSQGSCTQDSITVLGSAVTHPDSSLFGHAPRLESGVNVSGGRQDLRYYLAGELEDADGAIRTPPALQEALKVARGVSELPEELVHPNTLSRAAVRANVTAVMGEQTELRVNTGYIHGSIRSLYPGAYWSGAVDATPTDRYGYFTPNDVFSQSANERTDRFVVSGSGQWRPSSWLTSRGTLGIDLSNRNTGSLVRPGESPRVSGYSQGGVSDKRLRQLAVTAEGNATVALRRGRVGYRTSAGLQYVRNVNDQLIGLGSGLPPGGTSVGEASTVYTRQDYAETVTLGGYVEESVGLNDRLFLTGAVRIDGASSFGRNYEAAAYPKVSVSWLLSDEPFLPRIPGLDELRVRYAYGAAGQQPKPEWALPLFTPTSIYLNGASTTVPRLTTLGNASLRPERVREHEMGLDATLLADRLRVGLTWYQRRTADQIVTQTLPPGNGYIYTNLGLTKQHGFEAELTAHLLQSDAIGWDLMLNHALHTTELVDMGSAQARTSTEGGYMEGYPLGARFVRTVVGYSDANADGILTVNELQMGPAAYAGQTTAPRSLTLTSAVGLFSRRLRLSASFERRTGGTQRNRLREMQCQNGNCPAAVYPTTPLAEQAQIAALDVYGYAYIESGDFTRFRELSVSLDLPSVVTRSLRMRSGSVSLSGRNLALWSSFRGPDPESAAVDGLSTGYAIGVPQGRTWSLRLDLGL